MSKLQLLNVFVTERLSAAAVEIFGAVEKTIAEYQEEICRSAEANERHRRQLDMLLNVFVTERLSATAAEIFEAVEKTIAEYQEEIFRSAEENDRLRREMDMVIKPDIKLHRTGL
ncbi:unnamed protein product [Coregonus sp. 'balchen']|nr:unnamed protein product [Coregonus sp. 'balchen']